MTTTTTACHVQCRRQQCCWQSVPSSRVYTYAHTHKQTHTHICTVYSVAARSSAAKNKGRKSNNANAFSFSRLYWVAYCQALLHPHSECVFVLGKCFVWFERVCVRANVALVCMCGVIQVDMFTYSLFRLVRCAGVLLLCLPGIAA